MLKFGTDGVRGLANAELTPELTLALGRAAARVLGHGPWLIGRDTRRSGPLVEAALVAGLTAEGADAELLGVVPTPCVAHLSASQQRPGAVISASHNPFADNGVKCFAPGGMKLSDAQEARLEEELAQIVEHGPGGAVPIGVHLGVTIAGEGDVADYRRHLVTALGGRRLDGLHVVLDCANGAASALAPAVFADLGVELTVVNAEPDGLNINAAAGSTHPATLQEAVRRAGADAGLAFDGDADRVIAVDETGAVVDGDQVIALCARALHDRGELTNDTVVVTVMSNLGFRLAMNELGISVVETPVGDRHVLAALERGGHALGGEQSGHVIFRRLATTGDGLLTGLQLLDVLHQAAAPLSELAGGVMTRLPQVLRNVTVEHRPPDLLDRLADPVARAEAALGDHGRVLLRPSGTEPVVRVMVEAPTEEQAAAVAGDLVAAVEACVGSQASS